MLHTAHSIFLNVYMLEYHHSLARSDHIGLWTHPPFTACPGIFFITSCSQTDCDCNTKKTSCFCYDTLQCFEGGAYMCTWPNDLIVFHVNLGKIMTFHLRNRFESSNQMHQTPACMASLLSINMRKPVLTAHWWPQRSHLSCCSRDAFPALCSLSSPQHCVGPVLWMFPSAAVGPCAPVEFPLIIGDTTKVDFSFYCNVAMWTEQAVRYCSVCV